MRDELKPALTLARELDAADLPYLIGELETIRCIAVSRLSAPVATLPPDELLDVQEVAARLHMGRDWVYRRARKLPFFCNGGTGRALRFSAAKLDMYLKQKSK